MDIELTSTDLSQPSILSPNCRGITNPAVLLRLEAARLATPGPDPTQVQQLRGGPRYEYWRPWYSRLLAKGCARCGGGEPSGWVQRQIQTPYRFKRFLLWAVNLMPRGASLIGTVASKRVSLEKQAERDAACGACPGMVIQLRVRKGTISETRFCAECSCPRWFGSRLDYKNKKAGHRCPLKRHPGSDHSLVYAAHLRAKTPAASGEDNGRADADRGGSNG